jgi:hypothetical protein
VFEAVMRLTEIISSRGNISLEEVREVAFATKSVRFLFNKKLQDYCDKELYTEALAVHMGKQKIESLAEGEQRDESTGILQDRIVWFIDQRNEIPKRFAPFLRIRG